MITADTAGGGRSVWERYGQVGRVEKGNEGRSLSQCR